MLKRIQQLRQQKGFTLVELLVVVTILGVLAAVAVVAVGGSSTDSRVAACKTDVATVQAAADSYYAKNGTKIADGADASGLVPTYLRSVPTNTAYTVALVGGVATSKVGAVVTACSAVT